MYPYYNIYQLYNILSASLMISNTLIFICIQFIFCIQLNMTIVLNEKYYILLVAWWHQAITWTKGDLLSKVFYNSHIRTICAHKLNACFLRLHFWNWKPHLPGASELMLPINGVCHWAHHTGTNGLVHYYFWMVIATASVIGCLRNPVAAKFQVSYSNLNRIIGHWISSSNGLRLVSLKN